MVDDMTTNGSSDLGSLYARLSERVDSQGNAIIDLRSNMNTGFHNLQSALSGITTELRGSSRTQWPVIWSAIGVSFAVLAAVGALAYRPVLANQDRLEAAIVKVADVVNSLPDKTVSRQEMDWRTARGAEDRARTEQSIVDLRTNTVARAEWLQQIHGRDQEVAELSRRIDEIRQQFGSVYGQRDVILDMRKDLDMLRQRLYTARTQQAPALQP